MRLIAQILLTSLSLITVPSQAEEYPFDRLFTNDRERQMLDDIREGGAGNQDLHTPPQAISLPETGSEAHQPRDLQNRDIQFSGFIRRDDGTTFLWVDGVSELSGNRTPGRMVDDRSAAFKVDDRVQQLKPGQTWLTEKNAIIEVFKHRSEPINVNGSNIPDERSP